MSSTTGPNTTTCHPAAAQAAACGSSSPPRSKPTVYNGPSTPTSSPQPSKPKPHNAWKGSQYEAHVPTIADRVVQASLKLVLEPIFEADFYPCSYGFRPNRRARDAVAEITLLTNGPRNYDWIVEGDIKAC